MANITRRDQKLLASSHFFTELLSALRRAGLIGERRNALVVYIVATSRLLGRPLCLFVKGASSSGENFLVDHVFQLLPPTAVERLTSSSLRVWNYLGRRLAHRVLYTAERNEAAGPVHPARLLISEAKLIHITTVKKGGRFVQQRHVTQGPIASITTTTKDRVEVDDESRNISIWSDETRAQTTRIMRAAVEKEGGLAASEKKVWHRIQQLIQKRAAVQVELPNWFSDLAQFVRNDNLWARRYFPAFAQACRTVALIRSFRPEKKSGKRPKKIRVRFSDYAIATLIFDAVFDRSVDRADDEDLEVQGHVRRISARKGGKGVRAADLVEELSISADEAYALLRKAASAGTIFQANKPSKNNVKLYLPAKRRSFLPDPAEVFQKLEGLSGRVKFVHPLTGEWIVYTRRDDGD
jgi:hypothetical protein